jgi:hypothetical protein
MSHADRCLLPAASVIQIVMTDSSHGIAAMMAVLTGIVASHRRVDDVSDIRDGLAQSCLV